MIREDILQKFPDLFGTKKVNGRDVSVEETVAMLTRELRPDIAAALTARRAAPQSDAPVTRKYGWPSWDETFADAVTGQRWSFRQIIQGIIDNFLGQESRWRWRLNDEVPVPKDAQPLANPGLELTGPWYPLDMAFNALNSPAPMNMPDFEDASPPHFQPDGTPTNQPVGIFAAMQNAKEIFEGKWADRPYEVAKKEKKRTYRINKPPAQWPIRFVRPPSIHVRYDHISGRWSAGAWSDRRRGALGAEQLRVSSTCRYGCVFLHPETAISSGSADCGEAPGAAGRHALGSEPAP